MQRNSNRHGAAVLRVEGARGVVFKIKFRDAHGVQVKQTVGRESDGWTHQKARAELDARLVDVRREGLTASSKTTFGQVADDWLATYPKSKRLKTSTVEGYASIVDQHLKPVFGHLRIGDIDVHHLERYVAQALDAGSAPRTANTHLNVVHAILKAARRRRLIRENVAELVERPAAPRLRWTILTPAELARVDTAFHQLAADEDSDDRRNPDLHGSPSPRGSRADEDSDDRRNRIWVEQARVVFRVVAALGLRRGEVLGLRWRNVLLADPAGPRIRVAETIVHGRADTPKSAASERTLAIGPKIAEELFDHRARSPYNADDDFVFCHPEKGTALDHKRYAKTLKTALAKAKITRPVRPFHDFRHSAITNAAIAGNTPAAIQARAGHADFSTTQRYINLAGVLFKDEAEQAEARILGTDLGTESNEVPEPVRRETSD